MHLFVIPKSTIFEAKRVDESFITLKLRGYEKTR